MVGLFFVLYKKKNLVKLTKKLTLKFWKASFRIAKDNNWLPLTLFNFISSAKIKYVKCIRGSGTVSALLLG